MLIVAGADYKAASVYIAIVHGTQLRACRGFALGRSIRSHVGVLLEAAEWLEDEGVTDLWLEAQFFMGNRERADGSIARGRSTADTLKLHSTATRIEFAAITVGVAVHFVHVATWRKGVFGNGRPEHPKERAIDFVRNAYGYEPPNDDAADSLCLATYGCAKARGIVV